MTSLMRCPGNLHQRPKHFPRCSHECRDRAGARCEVLSPLAVAPCQSPLTPVRQRPAPAR
eukprot:11671546-Alexandrium_andersonii.AAC.1